jgi:hypothetical protein
MELLPNSNKKTFLFQKEEGKSEKRDLIADWVNLTYKIQTSTITTIRKLDDIFGKSFEFSNPILREIFGAPILTASKVPTAIEF